MSRLEKTVGARSVLLLLLIAVLLRTGFSFGIDLVFSAETLKRPEIYYAMTMLQGVLTLGIPLALFISLFRPRYMPVLKSQLSYPPFSSVIRTVLAAAIGACALQIYVSLWAMGLEAIGIVPWEAEIPLPDNGAQILLAIVSMAVFPAILEELFFRGALLEGLKRELTCKAALLMTTLLFAFMHGSITGLPAHVALGLVITLLAMRQNNLQLPMLYHFSHNATSLIISLYFRNVSQVVDAQAQAAQGTQGAPLLLAMFSLLSMALLATYAFWLLMRPLLSSSGKAAYTSTGGILPMERRKKITVIVLAAVLLLLLLPWYVFSLVPA